MSTLSEKSETDALDLDVEHPAPDTAVLGVAGEVDAVTAPALADRMAELMSGGCRLVVVDLSAATFLASSGLAVLIRAANDARSRGRRFRVVAATRRVLRPLEVTGTDDVVEVVGSRAAALDVGSPPTGTPDPARSGSAPEACPAGGSTGTGPDPDARP